MTSFNPTTVATVFSHDVAGTNRLTDPTADQLAAALAAGLSVMLARPAADGTWPTLTALHHPGRGFQVKLDLFGTGHALSAADPAGDTRPAEIGCCGPVGTTVPGNTLLPVARADAAVRHFYATGKPCPELLWAA